jgi:two-component system, sensor histidine kinase and response regulator
MKTILLIDDDAQVRTMFGVALRRSGYQVIEAECGVSGLALARQHLPDLILSDIHMPGGDGSTLLRDLRHDPALKSKQVVLMTGRPDLVTPRKGMEEGADDFLVKPVSLKALLSCMEARFSRATINWRVEDEMLTQLKSSVPSNLPHECFTPLAGIIGLVEILRSDFSTLTPSEIYDIHDDIYHSALRLHRTLRNYLLILDLQTVSSQPAPPLSPAAMKESIQAGVNEALRLNERVGDVTLRSDPCSISMKAGDVTLIVEELVDNACKFSRLGTPVKVGFGADGQLIISDEGRGMTSEQINQIGAFQQFERKKNEQQGLGLGLVLVQKLIAGCGAGLSLESQPGIGTTARIAFPMATPA